MASIDDLKISPEISGSGEKGGGISEASSSGEQSSVLGEPTQAIEI